MTPIRKANPDPMAMAVRNSLENHCSMHETEVAEYQTLFTATGAVVQEKTSTFGSRPVSGSGAAGCGKVRAKVRDPQ